MRILIIRPGALGDTLLTLPVLRGLREYFRNELGSHSHITYVGNAAALPLMHASGQVEEVSDYEDVRWSALFSVGMPRMASMPVDLAICWLRDLDGAVERNLRAAGAQQVIIAPGRPPENERVHIVEYLAQTIGIPMDNRQIAQAIAPDFPSNLPFLYDVAIHPGSGGAHKCWPVASFAAVIQRLRQLDRRMLLLGGPADHERIDALRHERNDSASPAINREATNSAINRPRCGRDQSAPTELLLDAPLLEVARHLCQCRCYLGNDAGITHLAALLGVPTIALFSASDPAIWHPVGPSVTVIYAPRWEEITVEQVVAKILSRIM